MGEDDIKKELGQIRQRIQQKKESSQLVELFKGAGVAKKKKVTARKIAAVRELEEDKRIIGAVQALLEILPREFMVQVEGKYPNTLSQLFTLASHIIEGGYGKKLQLAARSSTSLVLGWENVVTLLLIHVCKTLHSLKTHKDLPEIFEALRTTPQMRKVASLVKGLKNSEVEKIVMGDTDGDEKYAADRKNIDALITSLPLDRMERQALAKFFVRYLNSLANPSHVSVNMMLAKEGSVDKSIKAAIAIKSKTERSKSFINIVDSLFQSNRVDTALDMVRSIKAKKEVAKPLTGLIDRLLSPKRRDIDRLIESNQIDVAIQMAKDLENPKERNKILQRIVSRLARHDLMKRSLDAASAITDPETKDFALSSMVSSLVIIEAFDHAIKVADLIEDPGFREDAHSYIVRGLLDKKPFREVIAFVDDIDDPVERKRAAKVILSSVSASRNKKKVEEVCTRFALR